MADLIDRAALLADIDEAIVYSGRIGTNAEMRGANKIIDRIKAVPAVDAVEVVRCKDCKRWTPGKARGGDSLDDMQIIGGCPLSNFMRREKDFCSFGERRTDATD